MSSGQAAERRRRRRRRRIRGLRVEGVVGEGNRGMCVWNSSRGLWCGEQVGSMEEV